VRYKSISRRESRQTSTLSRFCSREISRCALIQSCGLHSQILKPKPESLNPRTQHTAIAAESPPVRQFPTTDGTLSTTGTARLQRDRTMDHPRYRDPEPFERNEWFDVIPRPLSPLQDHLPKGVIPQAPAYHHLMPETLKFLSPTTPPPPPSRCSSEFTTRSLARPLPHTTQSRHPPP